MVRLSTALLLLFLAFPVAAESRMVGLLVGMGHYQHRRFWPPVHGREDATRLRQVLIDRFGADPQMMEMLPPEEATLEGLRGALHRLEQRAGPGDTVVFFYAGHGAFVPDREHEGEELDEADGFDECLVPVDAPGARSSRFPDAVLRDDAIQPVLARLTRKVREGGGQGSVVLIFDSCHSGSMQRAGVLQGLKFRTGTDLRVSDKEPENRPVDTPPAGAVILTACADGELAGDDTRRKCGLFTDALISALESHRLGPGSTYRELMASISSYPRFSHQTPQIEGDGQLAVLGGRAEPRAPECLVETAQATHGGLEIGLSQGLLDGFHPGSQVAVGDAGGVITEAGPGRSVAILSGHADPVSLVGSTVRLTSQDLGDIQLKLFVEGELPSWAGLEGLARRVEESEHADLFVRQEEGQLAILRRSGREFLAGPEDWPSRLRAEARTAYLERLIRTPQQLHLELTPGAYANPKEGTGFRPSSPNYGTDGLLIVDNDSQAQLSVTNRSDRTLYAAVLDFLPEGQVQLLKTGVLPPGEVMHLPLHLKGEGAEGFKVLGSTSQIDLKGAFRQAGGPFDELLRGLSQDSGLRAATLTDPSDYVATQVLRVRLQPAR